VSNDAFLPPAGAFTRKVPIRFSHSDPAGIVYFPHYFDMFNALIEDWYGDELGVDYAALILGGHQGFPIVHAECDFKAPSRMGERLELTLLIERVGRSSLGFLIVGHLAGSERLRARIVTAMISLDTGTSMALPAALRQAVEAYQGRCEAAS
jgi:4-hydroxybenzoyl-CoA thioesterase